MARTLSLIFAAACLFLAVPSQLAAVEPGEILKDRQLEGRARALSAELRCLVCQNQSIDDSNAPLARDLRLLVRERLTKGDTNTQVLDFIVARYGEFVLLRPRFGMHTLLLWLAPPVILILAVLLIFMSWRRRSKETSGKEVTALSPDEKKRLDKLLRAD